MTYAITFILAYCSIVYELVMAQSLSAFLGDTVLRYSTTIGLYLASMGIGAFLCRGGLLRNPAYSLVKIEILLAVVGGFSVVYLHLLDILSPFTSVFFILSHLLIIAIGILTGFEIPLLIEIKRREKEGTTNSVLGMTYIGALSGTIIFPILLLPTVGVLTIAFLTGSLNAVSGLLLLFKKDSEARRSSLFLLLTNFTLGVILLAGVLFSRPIGTYFMEKYLLG
tara:strand:- start:54 stop:725 length:672 start_codon:yes stop_codon:yes gene_type:complete